jgi:hypothetical protein
VTPVDKLDEFTRAYITAALFSTNDESDPSGGEPLDRNFDAWDLDGDSLRGCRNDCADFQAQNAELLAHGTPSKGGTDFWLTRNHHGAGFWDGDWPEDRGATADGRGPPLRRSEHRSLSARRNHRTR